MTDATKEPAAQPTTDAKPAQDAEPKQTMTKTPTKAKDKDKPKSPRYGRNEAIVEALKGGKAFTRDELVKRTHELYAKHEGKGEAKGAEVQLQMMLPLLKLTGYVEVDEEGKIKKEASNKS